MGHYMISDLQEIQRRNVGEVLRKDKLGNEVLGQVGVEVIYPEGQGQILAIDPLG